MQLGALKFFSHYSLRRLDSLGLGTPMLEIVGTSPSCPVDFVAGFAVPLLPNGVALSVQYIEKALHMNTHVKS